MSCDQERLDSVRNFDSLRSQNVSIRSQTCGSWAGAKQQQLQEPSRGRGDSEQGKPMLLIEIKMRKPNPRDPGE
jgi:hypothetical protein